MNQSLRTYAVSACALAIGLVMSNTASAKFLRLEVEATKPAPPVEGAAPYEILTGRFYGELDPADRHNAIITDLNAAPRNARGMVEYSATFAMARPVDPKQASGLLFYDVPNRGNGGVAADPAGNVRVISGWQGDLPEDAGLQTINVPIAQGRNADPLTGPVLARFVDMPQGSRSLAIAGSIGRPTPLAPPLSLDTRKARLYVQDSATAPLKIMAPGAWAFADCSSAPFPGRPDPAQLCLKGGFDSKRAYTLVYEGKNPKVLGIGFAATRDLVAFLRSGRADAAGHANPAGDIRWTVASGTSQSGNFVKSFINLGFNADEAGRIVFDGANPNIAARQVPLNLRFAVPGGAARPFEPGSEGALWWSRYDDRKRGRGISSLLDRCTASATCPKIVETFGSAEFWGLRMSPGLVGTDAKADVPVPENVRRYYFPSVTHGGSWTGGFPLNGDPVPAGCTLPGNPNPMIDGLRAAQQMLIDWVRAGKSPAPNNYPTLAAGDLVMANATAMGWPKIPNAPVPDGKLNLLPDQDFGPGFNYAALSGVARTQPPRIRGEIPLLVPRVDADGNETSGVRSVQLRVPLGTYLGWNVQAAGFSKGQGCGFAGGFIPFAQTRAARVAANDPRPSLEERYGTRAGFLDRVRKAVEADRASGWLLPDDAEKIIAQAEASDVLKD